MNQDVLTLDRFKKGKLTDREWQLLIIGLGAWPKEDDCKNMTKPEMEQWLVNYIERGKNNEIND